MGKSGALPGILELRGQPCFPCRQERCPAVSMARFAGWSQSDPCWLAQAITVGRLGPKSGGKLHTQDVDHSSMRLERKGPIKLFFFFFFFVTKFFAYNNSSRLPIMTEIPTIKVKVRITQKSNIL